MRLEIRAHGGSAAVLALALSACSLDSSVLGPTVTGPVVMGEPKNAIERALAFCGEKTEAAETACVRKAVADRGLGPSALAAMIPGCRIGKRCSLQYRTRDRSGVLAATATDYVADWLVTVDLTKPAGAASEALITVMQI